MNDLEYNYVRQQILRLTGVDLRFYKTPQMQRRLSSYLYRTGYPDWPRLFRVIRSSPEELEKLKEYLTINVSSFFRDPQKYTTLQDTILPELFRAQATIRAWSAGCSRGQEAYSLAIALTDFCRPGQSFQVVATDIDRGALNWARAGGPYSRDDLAHVSAYRRLQYFDFRDDAFWVKNSVKQRVFFRQHNLLSVPVGGTFDLIVCRNVVIYFEAEAKKKLYQTFYDILRPGGFLFMGSTEIIPNAVQMGFKVKGLSFYQR